MHSQKRNNGFGALVQLVRMPACHAGGHGFESRTHRKRGCLGILFYYTIFLTKHPNIQMSFHLFRNFREVGGVGENNVY